MLYIDYDNWIYEYYSAAHNEIMHFLGILLIDLKENNILIVECIEIIY